MSIKANVVVLFVRTIGLHVPQLRKERSTVITFIVSCFTIIHSKHRCFFPIISRAVPCSLHSSKSDENLFTLFRTSP